MYSAALAGLGVARGDRVHLTIVRDHSDWGQSLRRSDLPVSDAQINAATETPVHFTLDRDAGVIDFTGSFESGEGVGRFVFTPSASSGDAPGCAGVWKMRTDTADTGRSIGAQWNHELRP